MALSDSQFQAIKAQLASKKAKVSESEYSAFLQRAAVSQEPVPDEDTSGFALDVAQGVAKSAGDIGLGLGTLGRGIQKRLPSFLQGIGRGAGETGESVFDPTSEARGKAEQLLERDTVGEKIGGFVGDVASFALPGGAAVKATKGANFLTRAASLGAADALTTTVRQGEFDRESVDAAIIGAAFPVVGKGAQALKGIVLPSGAEAGGKVVNSLIKPLLKDFSFGKNPGKAVAESGITAKSLDELAQKIGEARKQAGESISTLVSKNTSRFDASDSLSALDEALVAAKKAPKTNAAIIKRIEDLQSDLLRAGEDGLPTRQLKDLSADEMWQLKRDIGELARWTGNASDDEIVNKALTTTYSKIRNQLDDSVDGMSDLSSKYADLKSAEVATIYRDKIAARQGLISFTGGQAAIAAGLVSSVATGGVTAPLLIGASAAGLVEAGKSTAFKTKLATWLASASKDELQDAFTQAPWLRGAVQTVLFGEDVQEKGQ